MFSYFLGETDTKSENKYKSRIFFPLKKVILMHFAIDNSRFVFKLHLVKNIMGDKMEIRTHVLTLQKCADGQKFLNMSYKLYLKNYS